MFLARLENQVWAKTWPGTPNQASRFWNFFLGPIPELFSASGAQKKVPESGGLAGGFGPSFGPDLIFKSGQKHQKWFEMGPESTVRLENWST